MNQPKIVISKDKNKLDIQVIFNFLKNSYWAGDRTIEEVSKSIENSLCFGLFENRDQIGFGRIITDQVVFAYMADIFIVESKQGLGYGKLLIESMLNDSALKAVKNWYLITKDAQEMYKQIGFKNYDDPNKTVMYIPLK